MLDYFTQWGHMYIMHFGAWVSFMFGTTIYKNGLPDIIDLPKMLKTSAILAVVLSIFSSHSHSHYLSHFVKPVDTQQELKK